MPSNGLVLGNKHRPMKGFHINKSDPFRVLISVSEGIRATAAMMDPKNEPSLVVLIARKQLLWLYSVFIFRDRRNQPTAAKFILIAAPKSHSLGRTDGEKNRLTANC